MSEEQYMEECPYCEGAGYDLFNNAYDLNDDAICTFCNGAGKRKVTLWNRLQDAWFLEEPPFIENEYCEETNEEDEESTGWNLDNFFGFEDKE